MTDRGYISMRNEDGTQYYCEIEGIACWSDDYSDRQLFTRDVYERLEAKQEETRRRDCPDNGFYGVYNLRFTPA